MRRIALVTDSTAGLSEGPASTAGVTVVPASFAFDDERFLDGTGADVYARMNESGKAPRTFGVTESAFRNAFDEALKDFEAVLAVLTPFDVNPSFTTACAAMLAIQFDAPEAAIKVSNAGVGGAGLGALVMTLAERAEAGASMDDLLAEIDALEPRCGSLAVPADIDWLERAGRLSLVEERVGALDGRAPVVRVGTRFTGVSVAETYEAALQTAIDQVGARAGTGALNVCVLHAGAAGCARQVADAVRARWDVSRILVGEMSPTHGSQLGPGAVGIGVCPAGGGG